MPPPVILSVCKSSNILRSSEPQQIRQALPSLPFCLLQEWMTPQPSRRPDVQPEFEKLEVPLPKKLPGDPDVWHWLDCFSGCHERLMHACIAGFCCPSVGIKSWLSGLQCHTSRAHCVRKRPAPSVDRCLMKRRKRRKKRRRRTPTRTILRRKSQMRLQSRSRLRRKGKDREDRQVEGRAAV